jgi:hypothetical protein
VDFIKWLMFDPTFARAGRLWQSIIEVIETAEGKIATALESFTARQLVRNPQLDAGQRKLIGHRFAIEGEIDGQPFLDLFLATHPDLTLADRQLITSWHRSFVGLMAIVEIYPNGLEVMNWLTAKHYRIQFADLQAQEATTRLKVGDVIIAQLNPIEGIDWAILAPWISLGRLGRPKLAVAIGTFRQNYPHYLYSDAPELLEAAWESVAVYHDRFVEFFGTDELTMSGKELQTRIGEFQTWMTERQLDAAGVDRSKSLDEIATDAGVTTEELAALTETLGVSESVGSQGQKAADREMVASKVELPKQLQQAATVTALSHEYWGQMFLADYPRLQTLLAPVNPEYSTAELNFIHKCLTDSQNNAFVWRRLGARYPQQLELALGRILDRSDFNLATDLDPLLTKFNKFLEPDLPDLASVPIHLHELFQAAVMEVSKDKAKSKSQPKKTGFGAKS